LAASKLLSQQAAVAFWFAIGARSLLALGCYDQSCEPAL
jgi:hypothetical protein